MDGMHFENYFSTKSMGIPNFDDQMEVETSARGESEIHDGNEFAETVDVERWLLQGSDMVTCHQAEEVIIIIKRHHNQAQPNQQSLFTFFGGSSSENRPNVLTVDKITNSIGEQTTN
uniref:Uncharacterized protein n=1 Tax=Romanomermis culicivorax TaxID=13658 RepID=A0A915I1T4_ROMCU